MVLGLEKCFTKDIDIEGTHKIAHSISFGVHGVVAIANEGLQAAAKMGSIEYQGFMGYLSDYAALAASVSLFCLLDYKVKFAALYWGGFYTALELTVGGNGTYDPWDIACYWTGAGVGILVDKTASVVSGVNYITTDLDKDRVL